MPVRSPTICNDFLRAGRSWHVPWGPSSDWHAGAAATRRSPRSPRRLLRCWSSSPPFRPTPPCRSTGPTDGSRRRYKAESAARDAAETNEREANKARDLESAARKKAEKLVKLALDQNKNALQSQRYISVLIFRELRDVAGTQDLRANLIKTSIDGLRDNMKVMDMLAVVGADDKEGSATATQHPGRDLPARGGLAEGLGRYDEAMQYYRKMDGLAESLAADNPELPEARIVLASSKITLGEFSLTRLGDSKTALGYLERNLTLRREIFERAPNR